MTSSAKAYWIARVTVTDPEAYASYQALAPKAFAKYRARFLARGGQAITCEGQEWQRQVVIEFDSLDDARACYNSPEYHAAREKRKDACHAEIFIVEGI
ncbi:MAG: DUF1330 domain-containing protein [Paracoccus denitrificans]|uniref:DUF1330 domain-containing protein n=1 Tax=Paracoccus denitrificans TaxID=266 RepID=A0A533IDL6_PARDE|nr:MAG: DUF1330 domain-containing protein [Paracoccus denitrificans]